MKKSKRFAEEELERRIRKYGKPVLSDRCFLAAEHQKHHFRTSVASHSRQVALYTLKICRALQANGIVVDEEMAVRAALCHDLGIVGRKQKYKNNYECLRRHPVDSVEVAKRIFPQMDLRMEQVIRRHMWPLSLRFPTSREGVVVCMADKWASVADLLGRK